MLTPVSPAKTAEPFKMQFVVCGVDSCGLKEPCMYWLGGT